MSTQRKPDIRRGEIAFIFAIVLGLLLGKMIRNIRIGVLIGIALGLLIVFARSLGSERK